MTDNEINIAIAEHLGWKRLAYSEKWGATGDDPKGGRDDIPSYATDLNACREMEISIVHDSYRWSLYTRTHLPRLCSQPICATARQRCEAFLRTVGKWREGM